ncbi:MAG TPA: HAD hydrolase-like protein [Gaiellaceae bacterium]|nr:HAD hydrolase-like protein [Gaiellaceae bacterium]
MVCDLDGTLVRLGVDWDAVRVCLRRLVGARAGGVAQLLRRARAAGLRAEAEAVVERAELDAAGRCEVNEALLALLAAVPARVPVAVCSANGRRPVGRALARAGLDGRVAAVVGREDVERGKPAPDGLLALLDRFGARRARTVLVGDSELDERAAAAARVRFVDVAAVGVRWRSLA